MPTNILQIYKYTTLHVMIHPLHRVVQISLQSSFGKPPLPNTPQACLQSILTPISSPLQSSAADDLLSISTVLSFPNISYKWNHTIYSFMCLALSLSIRVLFHICIRTLFPFIAEQHPIIWIHHICLPIHWLKRRQIASTLGLL